MNRRQILALLVFVLFLAHGAWAGTVGGRVYYDANSNAISIYRQNINRIDEPIAGNPVELIGIDETRTADTDTEGNFDFGNVPEGDYLIHVVVDNEPVPECTSHNQALHLTEAIANDHIKYVAFGDSNGVYGSDKPYPDCLTERLAQFADVELVNKSVSGSTASEWLPGGNYFENTLVPELADADLVTFTLGGNDIINHFGWSFNPEELWDLILAFPPIYQQIIDDITTIADEIHAINPDADIVYLVYPSFSNSLLWRDMIGEDYWPWLRAANYLLFYNMRYNMAKMPYLVLGDILGSFPYEELIDNYLFDQIHPNDIGHQYYADQVFLALGGVIVDPVKQGEDRLIAFDSPDLAW